MLSPRISNMIEETKDQEKVDSITSHGYFKGHKCHLPKNKISGLEFKCSRLRQFILDLTTVQMADTRARRLYRSYAEIYAEKYRQFKNYPYTLHPYSKLRLWLEIFFTSAIVTTNILMAVHYSATHPAGNVFHEYFLLALDVVHLFNIFIDFFTGYVKGYSGKTVVLDLKLILIKYSGSWLLTDILSTASILHSLINYDNIILELILASMRMLRTIKLYFYMKNLLLMKQAKVGHEMVAEMSFFLISYLTWNMYFQFAIEYIVEETFDPIQPRNCSWMTIGKLWNSTSTIRFIYAFDRAELAFFTVGMLRGNANLNLLEENGCFELFFMVSCFIAKMLVLHCTFKYVITTLGSESARAKYFIMAKQVETYMDQRKFPIRLKKKILKFYAIRFQSNFFVETRMMSCVSGQLKEDIIMHTGRQLVRDVAFLKQMPRALLLQIGINLRIVIFIAGDIIMKINTIGDCLYFIHKGTVAIYSESGKEVCHLEDGDFFGEIALVMRHRLRTASAVAVTNCELFQLDREDFESSVASYPTVYEDIKKIATNRLERTIMLDEHRKTETKMKAGKSMENVSNLY